MEFEEIVKSLDEEHLERELKNAWLIINREDRQKLLQAWEFTPSLMTWVNFVIHYAEKIIEKTTGKSGVWLCGADDFETRFASIIVK